MGFEEGYWRPWGLARRLLGPLRNKDASFLAQRPAGPRVRTPFFARRTHASGRKLLLLLLLLLPSIARYSNAMDACLHAGRDVQGGTSGSGDDGGGGGGGGQQLPEGCGGCEKNFVATFWGGVAHVIHVPEHPQQWGCCSTSRASTLGTASSSATCPSTSSIDCSICHPASMAFEMEWSYDFCLACDRQTTEGAAYCSQACRLRDVEKGGPTEPTTPCSTSHPSSSSTSTAWTTTQNAPSGFYLPPAVNFAAYKTTTSPLYSPTDGTHFSRSAPTYVQSGSEKRLSPSSSRSSLSSISSSPATPTQGLSDQALLELRGYANSFDQVRDMKRRMTLF
ncbi:hypothetical protein BDY21DRAFT_360713 [Lineolata rhizophorae]|uniref:Uncharacterized protein n=1 Tax=Lineolata rhizophorae TaxID=578093 RepID=A0A6A6PDY6_9PEZI|nr:hypothetical protein BDY21DRAFT_360713 [Lineolata rhizophorae]